MTLTIKLGERTIELTSEEAKQVRKELNALLGDDKDWQPIPYHVPIQPPIYSPHPWYFGNPFVVDQWPTKTSDRLETIGSWGGN